MSLAFIFVFRLCFDSTNTCVVSFSGPCCYIFDPMDKCNVWVKEACFHVCVEVRKFVNIDSMLASSFWLSYGCSFLFKLSSKHHFVLNFHCCILCESVLRAAYGILLSKNESLLGLNFGFLSIFHFRTPCFGSFYSWIIFLLLWKYVIWSKVIKLFIFPKCVCSGMPLEFRRRI